MFMKDRLHRARRQNPVRIALLTALVLASITLPITAEEGASSSGSTDGQKASRPLPKLKDVVPFITPEDIAALASDGRVLRFQENGVSPVLLPETPLTSEVIRQIVHGELNIGIEGLFFSPAESMPAGYKTMNRTEKDLILYNILRSVSTLQGLEYFSASRGEMRLLFEESWAVSDADSETPLPDPLVKTIPAEDVFLVHQKDKSFGTNTQEMTFRFQSGVFILSTVNLTPMRYKGLIKVVDPGNMQSHLIVVPVEEGLLIYGTMSAQTRDVKAFMDRARNSFTNRVIALAEWYGRRIAEEF